MVAMNPMIFIVLLFHTNSAFSIVNTVIYLADTSHASDSTPLANIVTRLSLF